MKYVYLVVGMYLFIACGGSKKVIQTTSENKTETSDVITNTPNKKKEVISDVEEKIEVLPKIEKPEEQVEEYVEAFDHQPWTNLLQKYVSANGKVNYKGFVKDRSFLSAYLEDLGNAGPLEHWSESDRLAYWLNVYNAFTIKLIIDHYPLRSIKEIKKVKKPWDFRFIEIKKKWYTLNDIEHRILRKMNDPRIHFGINCASFSCPPLLNKAFTAQNVDQQLEKLTFNFINDPKQNLITTNNLQLSKIFTWFASDFKKNGSLIDFLNKYSETKIHSNAKKSFKKYIWSLNE